MGHRPLPGRRVVLERQLLALVRQVSKAPPLHRLADLALDEALPARAVLRPAFGVAALARLMATDRSATGADRQAGTVRLLRFGGMDRIDGQPVYSATDLVAYLACEHLTQLERAAIAGLVKRPMRDDPELDVIRRRGFQHEARFLADLRAEGRVVVEIEQDGSIRRPGRSPA